MIRYIIALLAVLAGPAQSQGACANSAQLEQMLAGRYGEALRGSGVTRDGQAVMDLYTNDISGTWTVVLRDARGMSCILVWGGAFEAAAPVPPGEDG